MESASVDCSAVQDEWDDLVDYGKKYLNLVQEEEINLVQEDYEIIWWKLFNAVDVKQWSNVLAVIELLFCLPLSNGHLERVFSQLKLIKVNRRTSLGEDTLDQLIRINGEGPPLSKWDASGALELWFKEKTRRVNRKETHTKRASAPTTSTDTEADTVTDSFSLEDCEDSIAPS